MYTFRAIDDLLNARIGNETAMINCKTKRNENVLVQSTSNSRTVAERERERERERRKRVLSR